MEMVDLDFLTSQEDREIKGRERAPQRKTMLTEIMFPCPEAQSMQTTN